MPRQSEPRFVEKVPVREFYEGAKEALKLTLIEGEEGLDRAIRDNSLNRPAHALTGYIKYFAHKRIQVFGAGEMGYLRDLSRARQYEVLALIAQKHIPCMVLSRNLAPTNQLLRIAREYGIPLMRSPVTTREVLVKGTLVMERAFAPSIVEHATMMDVKGIGTLIRGHSGLGKSECALGLIDRGYSLVADDTVLIRLLNEEELMARSSELNRGFMEVRGIGIISVAELFGVRALRLEKHIDLVVTFVEWEPGLEEDRTGLDQQYYEILGMKVPHIVLPVRPGRDLAQLVEVAAMDRALKLMGHDSAKEFNDRLIEHMLQKSQPSSRKRSPKRPARKGLR